MTDWLLVLLATFNVFNMVTVYKNRRSKHITILLHQWLYSLIATEFSWFWLPLQLVIVMFLISFGGLESWLGTVSMAVLMLSWFWLAKSVYDGLRSETVVEHQLLHALGHEYRDNIDAAGKTVLNGKLRFQDWWLPFKYRKENVEVIKNISYGSAGIKNRLDIYRPKNLPSQGCPVLLQIHGGAWMMGSKDFQALPLMNLMASKGWICVSINYRLSPSVSFPAHLEDCKKALCWIRSHGKAYGMSTDFIAVTGGSAGGHLASLMPLTANNKALQQANPDMDTSIQACVPLYGVYDFLFQYHPGRKNSFVDLIKNRVIHASPEEDRELWELASPISQINENAPPFMIVHGTFDSLVLLEAARDFKQKLTETSSSPTVFVQLTGAEHAFDVVHSPRTDAVINGIHRFLQWSLTQHRLSNQK
jgi:acetyl esterase/lipase